MIHKFIQPQRTLSPHHHHAGHIAWQCPSNIALIKYWGKRPGQLPENASISFTLSEARTETKVSYTPRNESSQWIDFRFDGTSSEAFAQRIESYFAGLTDYFPFITQLAFSIDSMNTFPHSSGIASSASAMSALAMCLCDIEQRIWPEAEMDLQKASFIARLGSGSASRSIYPSLAVWGKSDAVEGSSDEYAIPYTDVHPIYRTFHDDVLIVSALKKSVSSSAGHALMQSNPYADSRYQQARDNMKRLIEIMRTDDLHQWGQIIESEALSLHALMMCSDPSYILMKPETLTVIESLRNYRKAKQMPVFFTLDAGPNIHILYPHHIQDAVQEWMKDILTILPDACHCLRDRVGLGPSRIPLP